MSDNDHLTGPMLSASMDEVIRLRARIEALETALRVIIAEPDGRVSPSFKALAATALAPEKDK